MEEFGRKLQWDVLRAVAVTMVIILHCDQITLSETNYVGGWSWWLVVVVNSLAKTAVPIFVMLSGVLVGNKLERFNWDLGKRVGRRLVVPLVFWIGWLFWWRWWWFGEWLGWWGMVEAVVWLRIHHLYYLVVAVGLYLSAPMLRRVKNTVVMGLMGSSLIVGALTYLVGDRSSLDWGWGLCVWFWGYFLVGKVLTPIRSTMNKWLWGWVLVGVVGVNSALFYWSVMGLAQGNGWFWSGDKGYYWWDALSPLIMFEVVILWRLMISVKINSFGRLIDQGVKNIARTSYAMYLVHPFIIDVWDRVGGVPLHMVTGSLAVWYVLRVGLVWVVTWVVANMVRRIPVARVVVGEFH